MKFRTKNWVEVNDDAREAYNTHSLIKFKTAILNSSPCDYRDVYIIAKGTITVIRQGADAEAIDNI